MRLATFTHATQQDEADGDEQQLQRSARRRDQILLERDGDDALPSGDRPPLLRRPAERGQLRAGLFEAHARAQPADDR